MYAIPTMRSVRQILGASIAERDLMDKSAKKYTQKTPMPNKGGTDCGNGVSERYSIQATRPR
jgi:hypothetical protein